MGWFDEEDDDQDDAPKRPKMGMMELGSGSSFASNQAAAAAAPQAGEGEGSGDDDPLDAYMKSLASTSTKESSKPPQKNSGRLDMDNEDEATSHWQITEEGGSNKDTTASTGASIEESSSALHQMFHKASDTTRQEHRQVDIQLKLVQHNVMGYAPFTKNLTEKTALASLSTSQGHDWRREHSISCHPPLDPIYDFAELRDVFPATILQWIANQEGMTQPTLVQSQTLPVALSGKDAIVTASTGSGKTLAYLWPLVAHLMENNHGEAHASRALVLVPTRELALQVEKVAKSLIHSLPFSALAITGGNLGRYELSKKLLHNKPHLVIATPGRLLDVLSAQQKSKQEWLLREITFLVLDEADKCLAMGFAAQVTQVLDNLRPDRQSLLFSATMHSRLERHCHDWMKQPTRISVGRSGTSSEHVQQHVLCLPSVQAKQAFLKESLPTFCNVGRTIVFCATREGCEQLAQLLYEASSPSSSSSMPPLQTLHGDKHPSDRKAALRAFTKGQVPLLIATDVAGRGLDIPQVATVINYDPAKNWDTHVHRIGRAGRLNEGTHEEGSAYTLLTPSNADFAQILVQAYQREGLQVPEEVQRLSNRSKQNMAGIGRTGGKGGLGFDSTSSSGGQESRPHKKSRWS